MKKRPILFSTEMVKAILEGRKTQTRRIMKPQPIIDRGFMRWTKGVNSINLDDHADLAIFVCPYGQVGDGLWVRETFVFEDTSEYHEESLAPKDRPYKREGDDYEGHYFLIPHYRATEPEPNIVPYESMTDNYDDRTRWTPAIHMPRWAS